MATCGSCKAAGQTVEHIKSCYADKRGAVAVMERPVVQASDFKPMALDVPDSHYAIEVDGVVSFYEVRTGKKGRWDGFLFLDHLVGAPGDWRKFPVKGEAKSKILALISVSPKASAVLYSKTFTVCAVCGSPLSDPESVASGLGPVCAKRF